MTLRLADIPFEQRDPQALFGFDHRGDDDSFIAFGWTRLDALVLRDEGGRARVLRDALVIAVHRPDDAQPGDGVLVEFWLNLDTDDEVAIVTTLEAFVDQHVRRVLGPERDVVLALCNPHALWVPRPDGLGDRRWHTCEGDVVAWRDGEVIRLQAKRWYTDPTMATLRDDARLEYVGLFVLKLLDLRPEDGGMALPLTLPAELAPLQPAIDHLQAQGLVARNRWQGHYTITPQGFELLGQTIDEAQAYIAEFDDMELPDVLDELRRRGADLMRVRFLWGWVEGEFDDLVLFQVQRDVAPIEQQWALYVTSDAFFAEIAQELDA